MIEGSYMIINFSDEEVYIDKELPSIFLAGPTLRNSSYELSWRNEACNILVGMKFKGIVYIPEFSKGENPFDFMKQAEWERMGLMNADIIVFYVPRKFPELPGFTTNVEFGMYLARRPDSVLFCSPEGAVKNQYLEWLYLRERPDGKIYHNLEEVLENAILYVNKKKCKRDECIREE